MELLLKFVAILLRTCSMLCHVLCGCSPRIVDSTGNQAVDIHRCSDEPESSIVVCRYITRIQRVSIMFAQETWSSDFARKRGENTLKLGIVGSARNLLACLLLDLFHRTTNTFSNLGQLATISKDKVVLQKLPLSDHVVDRVYYQ